MKNVLAVATVSHFEVLTPSGIRFTIDLIGHNEPLASPVYLDWCLQDLVAPNPRVNHYSFVYSKDHKTVQILVYGIVNLDHIFYA